MATKKEVVKDEEIKEESKSSKTKKIATGNTKKVVQKRSSSVAGKTAKAAQTTKTAQASKTAQTAKVAKTTKTEQTAKVAKETKTAQKTTRSKGASKEEKAESITKPAEETKLQSQPEEKKVTKSKGGTSKKVNKMPENEKPNKVVEDEVVEEKAKEVLNNEDSKELTETQIEEIKKVVRNELKENKKMPEEQEQTLLQKLFQNIELAVMVLVYFNFIVLGFINIENSVFLTDIKVFSMAMLIIAIGIFEFAYKKDSGRYAIHGIEILILAFVTMALLYINLMWKEKFVPLTVFISYVFCIYYVAKSIIIYCKMKKEYSSSSIKEMLKKEKQHE